jgi:alkaline phosphatase
MNATTSLTRVILISSLLMIFLIPTIPAVSIQPANQPIPADDGPLSIILMIGDGMGYEHVKLAKLVEVGEYGSLTMQQLMWNASVTTINMNGAVTDSAAAGTALATGHKTSNHMVGVLPDGTPLENIVEFGQSLNKSTGLVSTCRIVDATPATFATHVLDRYETTEIARQLVEEANVDVLLGGGTTYFSPDQINTMVSNGYSVVYNRSSLMGVSSGKLLGLFAVDYMDYEIDRNYTTTPSIAEMTSKSIELLSQDSDGFFLMVEGGLIDLAAHDKNKVNDALDTIEFDKAVKVALDYVKEHPNTVLMVTADHETMGLVVVSQNLNDELPSNLLTQNENETLRIARINNVTVDWTATYHTDWPVPLYCYGSAFSELTPDITIDNTDIFVLMKDYFLGNPLTVTTITTTTTTTPTTTTTTSSGSIINGIPLDTTMIALAATGAVIVVIVVLIILRKR